MTKLGAHLSIAGGFSKAIEKAHVIGANCLQIFSSSPRSWNEGKPSVEDMKNFVNLKKLLKISPIYFHAAYLINLANGQHLGRQSKKSIIYDMELANQLGIKGVIVHLGSFKNENTVENETPEIYSFSHNMLIQNIKDILAKTPKEILFIIENSGVKKIGQTVDEISKIIKDVDDKRVRVCFDTCHLHTAGYNLSTKEFLDQFLHTFNSFIGIDKLELWHLNDSKDPINSQKDRHENIGHGQVGTEVFRLLLNHPQTKNMPFIIETPGFDGKGPDKENLDVLKSMIEVVIGRDLSLQIKTTNHL